MNPNPLVDVVPGTPQDFDFFTFLYQGRSADPHFSFMKLPLILNELKLENTPNRYHILLISATDRGAELEPTFEANLNDPFAYVTGLTRAGDYNGTLIRKTSGSYILAESIEHFIEMELTRQIEFRLSPWWKKLLYLIKGE